MDGELRPALLPTLWLALAVNIPIGLVGYGWGFLHSYMLNDLPTNADLRRFLAAGLAALVLSAFLMAALMVSSRRAPAGLAVLTAVTTSLFIHGAFLLVALPPLTA